MKLLFKQRLFSWFDSYDIYNEIGDTVYTVKGELSWGHLLRIYDAGGNEIGIIKEKPKFSIECNGWQVDGDFFEWDYSITASSGQLVASVSKKLWNLTDTYEIDVCNPQDAVGVLMLVLAIDAEKCSRHD